MKRPLAFLCVAGGLAVASACSELLEPPADDPYATEHVFELAEMGDPDAQTALGLLYERGLGVEQDEDEAVYWYSQAAASGNALAEYHLGSLYERGLGVDQDYGRAAAWYKSASAKGSASAQAALAYLYERGLGVEQDMERARELYAEVARAWAANYAAGAAAPGRLGSGTEAGDTRPSSQMAEGGDGTSSLEVNLSALDEADGPRETVFDWPDTVAGNGERFASDEDTDPAMTPETPDLAMVEPASGADEGFAAGAAVGTPAPVETVEPIEVAEAIDTVATAEPAPEDDAPEQNYAAGAAAPRAIQPSDVPAITEDADEAFALASVLGTLAPEAGPPELHGPAPPSSKARDAAATTREPSPSPLAVAAGSPPEHAETTPIADTPVSADVARAGEARADVDLPVQPTSLIERLATEPIDATPAPRTAVAAAPKAGGESEADERQVASLPPEQSERAIQPKAGAGETSSAAPRAEESKPPAIATPPSDTMAPAPRAIALASLDDPRVPNVPKPPPKPTGFWLERHEPEVEPILRADETTKLEKWAHEETLLKKFGVESGHAVRLATLATPDAAIRTWQRLQRRHPALLGSLAPHMERVTYESAGAFIRLDAGPLASAEDAQVLCTALRDEGQACRPVVR